jgi:hypothetical protein
MSSIVIYPAAAGAPLAANITLRIQGRVVPVYHCGTLDFACVSGEGALDLEITCGEGELLSSVRPLHRGVIARQQERLITCNIDRPRTVYVEITGRPALVINVAPLETFVPTASSDSCMVFGPGMHDAGEITIGSGQTLYLAGGAWVRGWVRSSNADKPSIRGRGVLDGSQIKRHSRNHILFDACRDVLVEGITTVDTPGWNLVFGGCERVVASHLNLLGWVVSSDGIDVVGSHDVLISDCFLRNNDDCVAIKAMAYADRPIDHPLSWQRDVKHVQVKQCVCYNDQAGNALEVGFETRTGKISDILFEDIDVIGAHGEGGVFTIHNGDRALISEVVYRNIRVEHFYDRLIDFRVLRSRYSKDAERGLIRNIRLEHIQCIEDRYNTPSLIGGYDAEHPIQDVVFEDFTMGGKTVRTSDDLHLFTSHAKGIIFR